MTRARQYVGIGQFGLAYQRMLENDCHAPGSVDCALIDQMVRLCGETAEYLYARHTPLEVRYPPGARAGLERCVARACPGRSSDGARIEGIARFCAGLADGVLGGVDGMQVGGTEEQIIERGSDWCTDVARVGCALCQVAGLPARLVMLANTDRAYSGHVIIEIHRDAAWGAVDPATNVIYRRLDGRPATTWELMSDADLVRAHRRDESTPYTEPGQFRAAAVSNYFIWDREKYAYTVSGLNDYYRAILRMASRGWPGGRGQQSGVPRWLYGEDA